MAWARRTIGMALFLAGAAPAQPTAAPGDAIVVTGQRDRGEAIRDFIDEVTIVSDGQIAAFDAALCPASYGLPPAHNRVVAALIREAAAAAHIRVAAAPCRANVVVIVAADGADLLALLRRERPGLFDGADRAELAALASAPGPVRSWQIVEPRGADGRPLRAVSFLQIGGGQPVYVGETRVLTGVRPSRTELPTRQDLSLSIIVFDLPAIEGLTLRQLAGHAAMRALARTDPAYAGAAPGRTILSLFDDRSAGGPAADGLTRWDSAYLASLYAAGRTVAAAQQRSNMARLFRAFEQGEDGPPPER